MGNTIEYLHFCQVQDHLQFLRIRFTGRNGRRGMKGQKYLSDASTEATDQGLSRNAYSPTELEGGVLALSQHTKNLLS